MVLFVYFCWTHIHFWGHWYPCFGLLVTSPVGLKARVGSLIWTLRRHMWYTFLEIHLLCNTSASVYGQHSSWSLSPHACFSRGRMLDSNHRPPAWQADALTTRPQRPGQPTLVFTVLVCVFTAILIYVCLILYLLFTFVLRVYSGAPRAVEAVYPVWVWSRSLHLLHYCVGRGGRRKGSGRSRTRAWVSCRG